MSSDNDQISIEFVLEEDLITAGDLGYFFYTMNAVYAVSTEYYYEYSEFQDTIDYMFSKECPSDSEYQVIDRAPDEDIFSLFEEYDSIPDDLHEHWGYYARESEFNVEIEYLEKRSPAKVRISGDRSLFLILVALYIRAKKTTIEVFRTTEERAIVEIEEPANLSEVTEAIEEILDEEAQPTYATA